MITYGFHADHVVLQIILNVLVVLSVNLHLPFDDCPTVTAACSRRRQCVTHCRRLLHSELTYYPVWEPGTRLLEPGYPDSIVFYFLFLKFMLVELILAACTEYGRPTFSSCRVWQWLRLGSLNLNASTIADCFHILKSE